jgi:sugar/nucleoside kinase (ribokinase family)
VVVGDVIDDIIVVPHGPIRPDTDTMATITRHPGGSAGNTAAWLGWLGAEVDVVGRVGANDLDRHIDAFRALGATPHLQADEARATGTIVIVVGDETRTMLTDRGANAGLDVAAIDDSVFNGAGVLHLTGYSLFDAFSLDDLAALTARARAAGAIVTFDPGSAGFIADYGVARFRQALRFVDVLLPNLGEACLLAGSDDRQEVVDALLEYCPTVVLTEGWAPVLVAQRGEPIVEVAVEAQRAVDPTGAGDAFTAGLIDGVLRGVTLIDAAALGVRCAGVAVAQAGGRPPVATPG